MDAPVQTGGSRAMMLECAPALQGVSATTREALSRIATPRYFAAGEEILRQGRPTAGFFVLVSGHVKMRRRLASGRSVILSLFGPGDLFGAVAALGGDSADADIVALERAACLEVGREELFELFAGRPDLIAELLPVLTHRLAECRNCIVELTCYRVEARLARIFLGLAESEGVPGECGGLLVPLHLSRQEIADLSGTTLETAIRVMSRWGKDGIVETREEDFLVHDPAALREIAGL